MKFGVYLLQYWILLFSAAWFFVACGESSMPKQSNALLQDSVVLDSGQAAPTILGHLTIATPVLKIRKAPNTQSHIVDRVQEGDRCAILEKGNCLTPIDKYLDYWYCVRCNDVEGWVYGGYTSAAQAPISYSNTKFKSLLDSITIAQLPFNWDDYNYQSSPLDVVTVAQYLTPRVNECDGTWNMSSWSFSAQIPFTPTVYILIYQRLGTRSNSTYVGTFAEDGRPIAKINVAEESFALGEPNDNFKIDGNFNITILRQVENKEKEGVFELVTTKHYSILPNGQIKQQH